MSEFEFEPGELVTVDMLNDCDYCLYGHWDLLNDDADIDALVARRDDMGVMVALEQISVPGVNTVMTKVFTVEFGLKWISTHHLYRVR